MTDWWEQIEHALVTGSEDAPDPWADLADGDDLDALDGLTDDQKAFLRQLDDQPHVGRFDDGHDDD